jgi:hypothetical protein
MLVRLSVYAVSALLAVPPSSCWSFWFPCCSSVRASRRAGLNCWPSRARAFAAVLIFRPSVVRCFSPEAVPARNWIFPFFSLTFDAMLPSY